VLLPSLCSLRNFTDEVIVFLFDFQLHDHLHNLFAFFSIWGTQFVEGPYVQAVFEETPQAMLEFFETYVEGLLMVILLGCTV
jgi:hypothetical protein